jgi:hypothetical protein
MLHIVQIKADYFIFFPHFFNPSTWTAEHIYSQVCHVPQDDFTCSVQAVHP